MPLNPSDPHDLGGGLDELEGEATAVTAAPPGALRPSPATPPRSGALPPGPRPEDRRPAESPHKYVPPPLQAAPRPIADPFAPVPRASGVPEGLVTKAPTKAFKKRGFTGTIMGTMVFIAQSKKIPLGIKIGAPVLLIAATVTGTLVYMQSRARDTATANLEAALELPVDEAVSRLRTLDLSDLEPEGRVRALTFLGEHRDTASVPRFMDSLDDTLVVQRAAVAALASVGAPSGTPAAEALVGLLEAEDDELRRDAAWALVRLEDGRGVEVTLANLAAGTPPTLSSYAPRVLAEAMGRDDLLVALAHPSPTVRQFAAYHLGDYCRPEDTGAISAIARDPDTATADTAIVTLARCDAPAAAPIVQAALQASPARWNGLYTRMQQGAGAAGLGLLLPHAPDAPAHRWIVHEMAASLDPRAAEALYAELARVDEPSTRDRLDTALALVSAGDTRTLEVLAPLLAAEDDETALAAIAMLGRSTDGEVVREVLLDLARSAPEARRRAAIDAMASAAVCGSDAERQLTRLLAQRPYRDGALRALAVCGVERAGEVAEREVGTPLESPFSAERGTYRLAALEAVASMGRAAVAPALFEQIGAPGTDPRIRTAIADVLAVLAPDGMRDRALDQMMDPEAPRPVRLALRRVLSAGISNASVPRLIGFVRGGADDDRTRDAAIVLGLARHAPSRGELVELLDDERGGRHAALVLMLGGDDETAGPVAAHIAADDGLRATLAADLEHLPWPLHRGRPVLPLLASAVPLRDAGYVTPLSQLCETLTNPPEGLGAPDPLDMRRALLETLTTSESANARELAAEGLACSGGRSAVLNVRDSRGPGAAEARRALSQTRAD